MTKGLYSGVLTAWSDLEQISSKHNPRFKQWRQLQQPRYSSKTGLCLIEGVRLAADAAAAAADITFLLYADDDRGASAREQFQRLTAERRKMLAEVETETFRAQKMIEDATDQSSPCAVEELRLAPDLFGSISDTVHSQGMAAILRVAENRAPTEMDTRGLYLLCDGVQDPGNLGAILRVAAGFDYDGVFVTKGTVWHWGTKVLRAAMGAHFHCPIWSVDSAGVAIRQLKENGIFVWAADLNGVALPDALQERRDGLAFVVGNEGSGLSADARRLADGTVTIPFSGAVESLNVAVATAIICYESRRPQARPTR